MADNSLTAAGRQTIDDNLAADMGYRTTWQNELIVPVGKALSQSAPGRVDHPRPESVRSDATLVSMVLAGDQNAFEEIFDRYKRMSAAVASRYFRQPEQIEEVIQIAFAKVYFELKNFRGTREMSMGSWIARITANASLDILRSMRRRPEGLLTELTPELIERAKCTENSEQLHIDRDLADKLLSYLATEDRALLNMLYAEEMSVAEAAEAFGWSISKTKVRAWRARCALRKIVGKLL
ncbi:MAG: sigma-70 family RNA polymerase sigma factor [Acidobacteriota bacterium]